MSGFRLPFPIFGFIAWFPKKNAPRFPWFRKKLGPILYPRSCRSFAVAPFSREFCFTTCCSFFNTFYCQRCRQPRVRSKVPCNHGVFSYVWETSWSWFKKCYTSKGFGNWENMPQNAPQLRQHPVPNVAVGAEKSRLEKCLEQTNIFHTFSVGSNAHQHIGMSLRRYVANKKVKFHHLRLYRYDPLRSCLAE